MNHKSNMDSYLTKRLQIHAGKFVIENKINIVLQIYLMLEHKKINALSQPPSDLYEMSVLK